jgi:large subunit ribosomal protein L4
MSATVLSVEAAKAADIEIIQNRKYTQALHDTIVALRAGRRSGSANTKTKAEVNLSGAKPWRQKGTGRARAGYKASPVWVGGGVVFGPKPRDYSKKVNRKVSKLALRKAFSERVNGGDVLVVPSFQVAEPKTKKFLSLLQSITPEASTLVVSTEFDASTILSGRNLPGARLATALEVNSEDLLRYRKVVVTNDALPVLAKRMALK